MFDGSESHHGCSSRRDFFKSSLGLAALSSVALAVPGTEVAAQTPGTRPVQDPRPVITRVIPKTKEVVPAIGLGTFMTFDVEPGARRDNLFEVTRRYWQAGGRIINISSSVTTLLQPTYGVYAATKAAVEAMTSVLTKELRGRNITVNAIAPGPTATRLFLDDKPQEVIDRLSKAAALERLGQPEDIAAAVAFLAGPDGVWINGQTLRANGGII
jgi:NAD(P)-dependent dehydrogenase (short-subunit alcohol dehydrogenase family)